MSSQPKEYLARDRPWNDGNCCEHDCDSQFAHLVRQLDIARGAIAGLLVKEDAAPIEQIDQVAALRLALTDLTLSVPDVDAWCIVKHENGREPDPAIGFKTKEQAEASFEIVKAALERGRREHWPKLTLTIEMATIGIQCIAHPEADVAYITRGWGK